MKKRQEIHSRDNGYLTLRRNALLIMGYCPECLGFNDRFPNLICETCRMKRKVRQGQNDNSRNLQKVPENLIVQKA